MSRFHTLKIKAIARETADCVRLTLDVPAELRAAFGFAPGQYLTLRHMHQGEELRRAYSLCSSPLDGEWQVAIKQVPGGRFSTLALAGLRAGQELDVLPPAGHFHTPLHPAQAKHYALFGAGSGITPLFSILKTVLLTEPRSRVTLVYGNRGRNSIIFKEALEGLKNKFLSRLSIYHVLSREPGEADLLAGRIDEAKTRQLLAQVLPAHQLDECFICGPGEMVHGVRAALTSAGVAPANIHCELFGPAPGRPADAATAPRPPAGADDKKSLVTLQLDGSTHRLDMSYYGNTILDAALASGLDAPYSCKNGMCSTCLARVTTGRAAMDVNYALSEAEVARGYVLTCQARPVTAQVTVDFDQ